jgi:hypothetical protein
MKKFVASLMLTSAMAAGVGVANAQTSTPTTTPTSSAVKTTNSGFAAHAPAIANALGITVAELNTALASGKTVAALAKEKGVDLNKIIATWVAEEQAEHPTDAAADVAKRVTDQANGVASTHGGKGGRNKGGNGGFAAHAPGIAKSLGMTTEELSTALATGKTVAALAKEKGADLSKIIAAWVAEEQAEHPDMAAADVTKRVTDQANGVALVGGSGGGGKGGRHGHKH